MRDIDSVFDARMEIYDTLVQRKSNLESRAHQLAVEQLNISEQLKRIGTELDELGDTK